MVYNDNQSPLKGTIMKPLDSAKKFVDAHKEGFALGVGIGALVLTGYGLAYSAGYISGSKAIDVAYTCGYQAREAALKMPIPSH